MVISVITSIYPKIGRKDIEIDMNSIQKFDSEYRLDPEDSWFHRLGLFKCNEVYYVYKREMLGVVYTIDAVLHYFKLNKDAFNIKYSVEFTRFIKSTIRDDSLNKIL